MSEIRRCIFHIPYQPDPVNRPSGTNVRPGKMLQGFKDAGFDVLEVVGDSRARRSAITEAKRLISEGASFDFVYSESETMPTMLTDADHLPRHPLMDFSFMKFCRKNGIPVGLFYRDAYWMFNGFGSQQRKSVHQLLRLLHKFDLWEYKEAVDVLFVPSEAFGKLVNGRTPSVEKIALPSGCTATNNVMHSHPITAHDDGRLALLYVGGISQGEAYDLSDFISGVAKVEEVSLDLCVRNQEWDRTANYYSPLLNSSIRVHHVSGEGLVPLYDQADIGALIFRPSPYRDLCMPVKLFEYLAAGLPVLALRGTAAGDFVEQNGVGWTIDAAQEEIVAILMHLCKHPEEVERARARSLEVAHANTWEERARQVARSLGTGGTARP